MTADRVIMILRCTCGYRGEGVVTEPGEKGRYRCSNCGRGWTLRAVQSSSPVRGRDVVRFQQETRELLDCPNNTLSQGVINLLREALEHFPADEGWLYAVDEGMPVADFATADWGRNVPADWFKFARGTTWHDWTELYDCESDAEAEASMYRGAGDDLAQFWQVLNKRRLETGKLPTHIKWSDGEVEITQE